MTDLSIKVTTHIFENQGHHWIFFFLPPTAQNTGGSGAPQSFKAWDDESFMSGLVDEFVAMTCGCSPPPQARMQSLTQNRDDEP